MSFAAQLAVLTVVSLAVLTTFLDYQTHRGLLWGWQTTFGAMLLWLHDHARIHIHIPHVWSHTLDFGGVFGRVNNRVVGWLQERLEHAEHEYALSVHALEATWHATVISVEWLAHETAATFEWLNHVKIRQLWKFFAAPGVLALLVAKVLKAVIPHLRHGTVQTVKVIEHAAPAKIIQVFKTAADTLPYPPWIIHLPKRIGNLERDVRTLRKALSNPKALIGAVAGAAIMANSLGLGNNWRCVTRGNIGKTARRLCGLSPRALEDLLGLLADVLILENICNVITLMEKGLGVIQPELTGFIDTAEAQFVHCNYQLVGPLPDVQLSLPPVTGLVLSLP